MKRIILLLTVALIMTAMTVAVAPAMAQEKKEEEKKEEKKEEKDLPKSGGLPVSASVLGLGAGALLVGGGLVAVRVTRRH
jgi:uncharacterized membrane protein YfcA